MNKNNTLIIIIVAVVLVFGIFALNKNKTTQISETPITTPVETPIAEPVATVPEVPTATPTEPVVQPSNTFTLAQVAAHSTEPDCYAAVNSVVYDLTAWINKHPGGSREILRICGKDGSKAFNGQHGGDMKAENILAGFEVGTLIK